jgi:hypothetical protein
MYMSASKIAASDIDGEKVFVLEEGASLSIGDNQLSASDAVVWIERLSGDTLGEMSLDYRVRAYLEGEVDIAAGPKSKMTGIARQLVERGNSLFVTFIVSGQVIVNSEDVSQSPVTENELYRKAAGLYQGDKLVVDMAPQAKIEGIVPPPLSSNRQPVAAGSEKDTLLSKIVPTDVTRDQQRDEPDKQPEYKYPVNIAALWKPAPKVERSVTSDGQNIVTIQGRFYIWQRINEEGDIVEFQADDAVIFYSDENELKVGSDETGRSDLLAGGAIDSIYIEGDIIMTEGGRTIKADRL